MRKMWYLVAALGIFLAYNGVTNASSRSDNGNEGGSAVSRSNPWNLPDVDSSQQGGSYTREHDEALEEASSATQVPFALLKAHMIRESSGNAKAYHYDNEKSGSSYGIMQVEWIFGSNRFAKYGFPDSEIGLMGDGLYDPYDNAMIGACIVRDNLNWLKGALRDSINAYNTGKREKDYPAPVHYVDDVMRHYAVLIGRNPLA